MPLPRVGSNQISVGASESPREAARERGSRRGNSAQRSERCAPQSELNLLRWTIDGCRQRAGRSWRCEVAPACNRRLLRPRSSRKLTEQSDRTSCKSKTNCEQASRALRAPQCRHRHPDRGLGAVDSDAGGLLHDPDQNARIEDPARSPDFRATHRASRRRRSCPQRRDRRIITKPTRRSRRSSPPAIPIWRRKSGFRRPISRTRGSTGCSLRRQTAVSSPRYRRTIRR
mgnify:CR=1 FL=1